MDKVRCPACRGSKKVAKLGGIIGECNTCKGDGTILAADKPMAVNVELAPVVDSIVQAVADCLPVNDGFKDKTLAAIDSMKLNEESVTQKVTKIIHKKKK